MVVTLYAERCTLEVAQIAGRLSRALGVRLPPPGVVLAIPHALPRCATVDVAHEIIAKGRTSGDVTADLARLARQYAMTLVTWSGAPDEQVIAALDASDRVLVLSAPSVTSLRWAQRSLRFCSSLGYGIDKISVVLHGFDDDAPLTPFDAADALKRDIFWTLPGGGDDECSAGAYLGLAERLSARA